MELGYTADYAAAKEAAFTVNTPSAVLAFLNLAFNGAKAGAQPDILPPPKGGYDSYSLSGFTIYHQKTKYYCLVATSQTIAHYVFGGYTSPSIEGEQDAIADAMGTTQDGTSNKPALDWTNDQFNNHGSSWRYVVYDSNSWETFATHAEDDIFGGYPMYVRVQLASDYYPWSTDTSALHATLVTGWADSGNLAKSADPWSHPNSNGTCNSSWDKDPDHGCIWGTAGSSFEMSDYFKARDPNGNPEWY